MAMKETRKGFPPTHIQLYAPLILRLSELPSGLSAEPEENVLRFSFSSKISF
jgi:hypothetical protein